MELMRPEGASTMRLGLASFFAVALLAGPSLGNAAVEHSAVPLPVVTASPAPAIHVLAPVSKLPVVIPAPVTGPPVNPSTPTVWLKPTVGNQVILSSVSETMSPQGNHGCMLFTITAALNPTDAVTVLGFYNENEVMREARVYAPGVIYALTNAVIKSYSASAGPSGSSVHLTLNAQKMTVTAGGTATDSDCLAG
jgi:hypothetical protein